MSVFHVFEIVQMVPNRAKHNIYPKLNQKSYLNWCLANTINYLYVIMYVCQNFGVRDVRGKIPKNIYQASYLLSSDFPNNYS